MTKPALRLAVFDLDFTVWDPEMCELHGEPRLVDISGKINEKEVRTKHDGKMLVDGDGTPIRVLSGASYALADINRLRKEGHDIRTALASKAEDVNWAQFCLDHLVIDEDATTISECAGKLVVIQDCCKKVHFEKLQELSGVPYENMVFFDNDSQNIKDVSELGVKCYHNPDGLMQNHWDQAKRDFGVE